MTELTNQTALLIFYSPVCICRNILQQKQQKKLLVLNVLQRVTLFFNICSSLTARR